jgi:hypothetical protein
MRCPVSVTSVRGGSALLLGALLAVLPTVAAAEARDGDLPLLAGPVLLGPADVQVGAATMTVAFGEGARVAHVELVVSLSSAAGGELVLGFAGLGAWRVEADLDGLAATVEPTSGLPLGETSYDSEVLVRVPLVPGSSGVLRVRALGDSAAAPRDAALTYPQASFLLNRLLEEPTARTVRFLPGALLTQAPSLTMRVETVPPQWPEAPVAGNAVESAGRWVLEGPVVADLAVPLEVSALTGEYEAARNWGFIFGVGAAIDWPRCEGVTRDPATREVTSRYFYTPDFGDPASRVWFRGLFAWAIHPQWRLETGVEGDFAGALEVPLTFTWFPQDGEPGLFDLFGDYHFIFGLALQLINDRMPYDYGFDPRPFVRLGAGIRFLLVTLDMVYEIAPPLGDWDGRRGGLEHKLLITLPFAF